MTPRRVWGEQPLLVGGVLLGFFAQVLAASLIKTPTFDEPAHIGAGFSYLKTGDFRVNLQHPPLLKEIGALPLLLTGARWPMSDHDWRAIGPEEYAHLQWRLGNDVIFANDPDRVMFWTRLPFIVLATLLGWSIYAWGRRMLGGIAAFGALLLFALDPTIAAHAPLVTTDVGCATFATLFLFALWRYLSHRTLMRLLWCGAALGAARAAQFSKIVQLPIAAVLLLGAARWIPAAAPARPSSLFDPFASSDAGPRIVWSAYALLALAAVGALVVHATYFFSSSPHLYLEGIRRINADHDPSYWPYMAGQFRPWFWSYYLVCYLLKEPIPLLVLVAVGMGMVMRRAAATAMDRAFLAVPPLVFFVAYTVFSDNLGIRYLIPALPCLYLIGGAGFAALVGEGGRAGRLLAVALCAWLLVGAVGIYPDHLSYFNEAACVLKDPSLLGLDGGSRCGTYWLEDSNVDWGQGLKQLLFWLDRHPDEAMIRFAYFGSIRPERYGLLYDRIGVEELLRPPSFGRYAVSAHFLARALGTLYGRHGSGPGNWLLHTRPTAIVGHAYYVYDVPRGTAE
jgi:hypothetical protein